MKFNSTNLVDGKNIPKSAYKIGYTPIPPKIG